MALERFPFSQPTREDMAIRENRGRMGVIFLRKNVECRGLGSGSIVNVEGSELLYKCAKIKWCLLTSDIYFPVGEDIGAGDCFFEYWSSDLKTVQKLSLRKVAQSNVFYRPTPGLALIPVCPSKVKKLLTSVGPKSSVLDERRTFSTSYYYEDAESESRNKSKLCFIMGFEKGSLTTERFTLITKKDDQGKLQHELQDYKERTFQSYNQFNDVWSHFYPYGAVILEDEGPQATCVGILNFTKEGDDWLISPVFFTPETLTGKVQLYYPTDVKEEAVLECPDARMEPTTSQIGYENHPPSGASLTNEDQAVCPDDYTLLKWQELYEEVRDENTKLKQQSERDGKETSVLKEGLKELRMDIKRTEQQNEELRAENNNLRRELDDLKDEREPWNAERKELLVENKKLREGWDAERKYWRKENKELRAENNELRKEWNAESEELLAELKELRADERESWNAERKELLVENKKLREGWDAERKYWRKENKELRAENNELRKEWNAESEELLAELKELRAENKALRTEHKELCTAYEELYARHKEVPDQLGDLLSQPNSALFRDDTSRIKDSNDAKGEGPSGTSANSPQEESDGSRKKDETFLDPESEDVSKLE